VPARETLRHNASDTLRLSGQKQDIIDMTEVSLRGAVKSQSRRRFDIQRTPYGLQPWYEGFLVSRAFVGVVSSINPRVDTPQEVRDRVLEAAEYIPLEQLGTTDDCGFAPFSDDTSTTRETAFAKIRARIEGTRLAEETLGNR
jgi:methionine synthase II (cobalamin-independent)